MKSVSDCLNFVDSMILGDIEKTCGIGNLEDVRDYMIGMYNNTYIEEMECMLSILSQINLILERFYLDNESDIKKLYCDLRKRVLDWLRESITKPDETKETDLNRFSVL